MLLLLLKAQRLQYGLSQETLAEMAGVSTRTIQRIESGKNSSIETAKAIASVLGLSSYAALKSVPPSAPAGASKSANATLEKELSFGEQISWLIGNSRSLVLLWINIVLFTVVVTLPLVWQTSGQGTLLSLFALGVLSLMLPLLMSQKTNYTCYSWLLIAVVHGGLQVPTQWWVDHTYSAEAKLRYEN